VFDDWYEDADERCSGQCTNKKARKCAQLGLPALAARAEERLHNCAQGGGYQCADCEEKHGVDHIRRPGGQHVSQHVTHEGRVLSCYSQGHVCHYQVEEAAHQTSGIAECHSPEQDKTDANVNNAETTHDGGIIAQWVGGLKASGRR